jgi:ABC-type cobalamin/Fe3+-siderophores transport system ATPase subunit
MVELVEVVRGALTDGVAVVWVEHVVRALLGTVVRLIALAGGRIIGEGPPAEVLASAEVREVFLGTAPAGAAAAETAVALTTTAAADAVPVAAEPGPDEPAPGGGGPPGGDPA